MDRQSLINRIDKARHIIGQQVEELRNVASWDGERGEKVSEDVIGEIEYHAGELLDWAMELEAELEKK
jgi:hypothetical protein